MSEVKAIWPLWVCDVEMQREIISLQLTIAREEALGSEPDELTSLSWVRKDLDRLAELRTTITEAHEDLQYNWLEHDPTDRECYQEWLRHLWLLTGGDCPDGEIKRGSSGNFEDAKA